MNASDEGMLDDIQVRLTFLDDAVSGLTSADADLARRLANIERKLQVLHDEMLSLRAANGHDPDSEPPPPHY